MRMEIGFFLGGMTRIASDQRHSSLQSGSFAIDASLSSSVRLRSFSQLVLLLRGGVSRETRVIFFSFISPRSSSRNDPADLFTDRTDHDNLYIFQKPKDHVTRFTLAV